MLHLPIERLAELADGEPTPNEMAHLEACTMCATELAAYRRLVLLAADERRHIAPPLTTWGALRPRLRTEGIITTTIDIPTRSLGSRVLGGVQRAAAVVALLGGGLLVGRLSAGLAPGEALAMTNVHFTATPTAADSSADNPSFASAAEALAVLDRTQRDYARAAQFLATHDTVRVDGASERYRASLAALDHMAETSLQALRESPQDPIMNQVYLTTLGAREMTINRLGTVLQDGVRLVRY